MIVELINSVVMEIEELVPNMEVKCEKVIKNNNIVLHGVTIFKKRSVSPVFYIENYLKYNSTKVIANMIVSDFFKEYERANRLAKLTMDVSDFTKIKDKIKLRLVNKNNNSKLLENLVWMPFLDLAIIAYVELSSNDEGVSSIRVTRDLLKTWGFTSIGDIMTNAKKNTFSTPYDFKNIIYIMAELTGMPVEQLLEMEKNLNKPSMYVLTNKNNFNGSVEIINYNTIQNISDKLNSDLLVIPSSIHEVIVMPYDKEFEKNQITQMVREVNGAEVPPEEVLSDHVYIFSRQNGWQY